MKESYQFTMYAYDYLDDPTTKELPTVGFLIPNDALTQNIIQFSLTLRHNRDFLNVERFKKKVRVVTSYQKVNLKQKRYYYYNDRDHEFCNILDIIMNAFISLRRKFSKDIINHIKKKNHIMRLHDYFINIRDLGDSDFSFREWVVDAQQVKDSLDHHIYKLNFDSNFILRRLFNIHYPSYNIITIINNRQIKRCSDKIFNYGYDSIHYPILECHFLFHRDTPRYSNSYDDMTQCYVLLNVMEFILSKSDISILTMDYIPKGRLFAKAVRCRHSLSFRDCYDMHKNHKCWLERMDDGIDVREALDSHGINVTYTDEHDVDDDDDDRSDDDLTRYMGHSHNEIVDMIEEDDDDDPRLRDLSPQAMDASERFLQASISIRVRALEIVEQDNDIDLDDALNIAYAEEQHYNETDMY